MTRLNHSGGDVDCWTEAQRLARNGMEADAIALCRAGRCADILECQRFLGWAYYNQDQMAEAKVWFGKLCEREDASGWFGMGCVQFVQRQFEPALENFKTAAENGYLRANHWVAYMLHQGLGTPRDIGLATDYYRKSARAGYLVADRALLHLAFQRGILSRIAALPRFVYVIARAGMIAYRNLGDERLVDIRAAIFRK